MTSKPPTPVLVQLLSHDGMLLALDDVGQVWERAGGTWGVWAIVIDPHSVQYVHEAEPTSSTTTIPTPAPMPPYGPIAPDRLAHLRALVDMWNSKAYRPPGPDRMADALVAASALREALDHVVLPVEE